MKLNQNTYIIQSILDSYITRLDVIFAKAYFGLHFYNNENTDAIIPIMKSDGIISINNFVHPILAFKPTQDDLVPINLQLSKDKGESILIISGPNGGGKTLTLKSFGLVCMMMKLAIPIPTINDNMARIDYFDDIFVDIGDHQNVLQGESTFMSKLNSYSRVIRYMTLTNQLSVVDANDVEIVDNEEEQQQHSLILLDELASGSDERMASSLGQALLEEFLQYSTSNVSNSNSCRVVTTTHSSSIKTMSLEDDRFNCASMSISDDVNELDYDHSIDDNSKYYEYQMKKKKPTYRIVYGQIGQSYAFNAASHRCNPPLPKHLLYRAYNIYDNNDTTNDDNNKIPTIMESLEQKKEKLEEAMDELQERILDIEETRKSTYLLAKSYETKLGQFDNRLQYIVSHLDKEKDKKKNLNEQEFQYKVVGKTISELRLMKEYINNNMDSLLKEKGLKLVSSTYQFHEGESVVIVKPNDPLEGVMANVMIQDYTNEYMALEKDEIMIIPSVQWQDDIMSNDINNERKPIIVKRKDIAIWDYSDGYDNYNDSSSLSSSPTKQKNDKLFQTLKEIELSPSAKKMLSSTKKAPKKSNSYTSSRARKAAMKSTKKNKKKK